MGAFDNARIVKINNKEIDSIKTNDGTVIYQRPVIATFSGSDVRLGDSNIQWLVTNGNVIVDWGDGSTDTVNNPVFLIDEIDKLNLQNDNLVIQRDLLLPRLMSGKLEVK